MPNILCPAQQEPTCTEHTKCNYVLRAQQGKAQPGTARPHAWHSQSKHTCYMYHSTQHTTPQDRRTALLCFTAHRQSTLPWLRALQHTGLRRCMRDKRRTWENDSPNTTHNTEHDSRPLRGHNVHTQLLPHCAVPQRESGHTWAEVQQQHESRHHIPHLNTERGEWLAGETRPGTIYCCTCCC
jgi:hypothetical protein